jgi:hypothetical protein
MSNIKTGVPSSADDELNLKQRLQRRNKAKKTMRLAKRQSPIPAQIRDSEEFSKFFKFYKDVFIPYAGTHNQSSQGLLTFLLTLKELSPTKCAIIKSKKQVALSGKIDITRKADPDFNLEQNNEASTTEKLALYEFIKENLEFRGVGNERLSLKQFAHACFEMDETCGNYYVLISKVETAGQRQIQYRIIPPDECLYLATQEGDPKLIAVSKIWDLNYIQRNPIKKYAVYPNFLEDDEGVERSVYHCKSGSYRWYGRPDDIGSLLYQFLEFQNVDYLNTQTEGNFTGQALIELEEGEGESIIDDADAQESGFDSFADQMQESFSNKSDDPLTIMMLSRPYGAKNAFVYQFSPNTNEQWYKVTNDESERQILKANNWPKKLLGMAEASGLSTNEFMDVFKIANVTSIRDIQQKSEYAFNSVLLPIAYEFYERTDFNDYSIQFTSPYEELLIQEQETEDGNNEDTTNE